jgi:HEPN domain-containing protein
MSKVPTFRTQVIKLYRDLIKLSKNWNATNPNLTGVEKDYIREETRKLFKANITISDKHEISEKIREAEARLAMAEHYRNPYPRPVNLPPKSYTKREGKKMGRVMEKLNEISKPIYVKSIDDKT